MDVDFLSNENLIVTHAEVMEGNAEILNDQMLRGRMHIESEEKIYNFCMLDSNNYSTDLHF